MGPSLGHVLSAAFAALVTLWSLLRLMFSGRHVVDFVLSRLSKRRRVLYKLRAQLREATDYATWRRIGLQLDQLEGHEDWKRSLPEDNCEFFDHKSISSRLARLRILSEGGDPHAIAFHLRSGLRRNIGGMCNRQLYATAHVGTKFLIEDYIAEVVNQLHYLCDTDFADFPLQAKYDFFAETRQAFGRSALLLSGGAAFGMYHLGVIKALWEQGLLPTIIGGSSVGAIVTSIVACATDDEMGDLLRPGVLRLNALQTTRGSRMRKVCRFVKKGVLMDIKKLQAAVRENTGDLTFAEAFERTGRILNISVTPTNSFEMPRLLNFLTSPNVLIWSAASASCALPGLYGPVELLAKDRFGRIVPYHPYQMKWSDGSIESDLPLQRVAEMFNVNHFIVSQVNPHVVPFINDKPVTHSCWTRLTYLVKSEVTHRVMQMAAIGLIPKIKGLVALPGLIAQKYQGDITIVPELHLRDYGQLLSNPDRERIAECVQTGQRATWPKLSAIRNHTLIEVTLNECYRKLQRRLVEGTDGHIGQAPHSNLFLP